LMLNVTKSSDKSHQLFFSTLPKLLESIHE
jgi:hypothetical protein